jgi:hypothetical protein
MLFLLVLFAAAAAAFYVWSRGHFSRLARSRKAAGRNFESFQSDLYGRASEEVIRTAYDFFSRSTPTGIPVLPSDSLAELFGIVDDDVPDELNALADECGVVRPQVEEAYRVQTVADAIDLLESLRRRGSPPSQ